MTVLRKLESRKEVSFLVNTFYIKVRKDELLGPIFNKQVKDWEHHLSHLTDFWETNLLGIRKYKGNPMQAHIDVDKKSNNVITQDYFGRWLHLWFSTIDEHFEGEGAFRLKNAARNMSTNLFMRMVMSRA